MKRLLFTALAQFLLLPAFADDSCPTANPADFGDPNGIDEEANRRYVLCSCGTKTPAGQYVLPDEESVRKFLILINNDYLARYDENCNLDFDPEEQAKYLRDQEKAGQLKFETAVAKTDERTKYSQQQLVRRIERKGEAIPHRLATNVLPDSDPKAAELSLSWTLEETAVQESEFLKLGYKFHEKPWRAPTTNSRLSLGLEVEASRKKVETSTNETLTRSVDFFPINYKFFPIEDLTFSLSAGATYLFTDETVLSSAVTTKNKDVAFVYKAGVSYQTALPCLSLGVDYKIRTGKFTENKLSDEWSPKITFNFLKDCRP